MTARRLGTWALICGAWTLVGAFFATQAHLYFSYAGKPISWWAAAKMEMVPWYAWAVLTPVILWLARRFRVERPHWGRNLALLAAAGVPLVVIKVAIQIPLARWTSFEPLPPDFYTWRYFLGILVGGGFHFNYLYYWGIVGLSHGFYFYTRYRERELRASQLEARLAQSQLEVLRVQLHPHFLFNTLHAISTLMHRDVEAAERMLVELGDLLRLSLETHDLQEVSLLQELDFVEHYLKIEQTRFQDRLTVQMDVEPDALDAQVPSLILQPLVENAIRHGIAPRAGAGRVEILARCQQGRLRLEVRDDGCGLPAGEPGQPREGLGLANTRARLQQLYGGAQSFSLGPAPGGGAIASLEIPFVPCPAEAEEIIYERTGDVPAALGYH